MGARRWCLLLLRNPQRFHAAGEFGADGDVLRTGALADSAADALGGALVAVLAHEPALLVQRRVLVAVHREIVHGSERA